MKSSLTRRLSFALMLACACAQPALASSLVASALALGTHSNDHSHSLVLQSDGGHIDVVLSHGDAPRDHEHPAAFSEDDHVVHISGGDVANTTPRRAVVQPALSLATSRVPPVEVPRVWSAARSLAPRSHGVDLLRTVVLRL